MRAGASWGVLLLGPVYTGLCVPGLQNASATLALLTTTSQLSVVVPASHDLGPLLPGPVFIWNRKYVNLSCLSLPPEAQGVK